MPSFGHGQDLMGISLEEVITGVVLLKLQVVKSLSGVASRECS